MQELRRAKHLREWLGLSSEQFEEKGAAWLDWAEQFMLMETTGPEAE